MIIKVNLQNSTIREIFLFLTTVSYSYSPISLISSLRDVIIYYLIFKKYLRMTSSFLMVTILHVLFKFLQSPFSHLLFLYQDCQFSVVFFNSQLLPYQPSMKIFYFPLFHSFFVCISSTLSQYRTLYINLLLLFLSFVYILELCLLYIKIFTITLLLMFCL